VFTPHADGILPVFTGIVPGHSPAQAPPHRAHQAVVEGDEERGVPGQEQDGVHVEGDGGRDAGHEAEDERLRQDLQGQPAKLMAASAAASLQHDLHELTAKSMAASLLGPLAGNGTAVEREQTYKWGSA
jgi:hypothetical protein